MAKRYKRDAWLRLGSAVRAARKRREDWKDMNNWADAVERSVRLVQGLERGESVGPDTLANVEAAFGWRPGHATKILEDPNADLAPDVPKPAPIYEQLDDVAPRPLDAFTTRELLDEVNQRSIEMGMQLHAGGSLVMIEHDEGVARVLDVMSPEARRVASSSRGVDK